MLEGKKVLIGVSGGIAAYKTAYLVSRLSQQGADVHVIMTENACKFISPLTFETLSGNECVVDTFERVGAYDVKHISLAKDADIFMVAPATANVIAKMANGLADDMLTTTFLACDCPKYVVPAMNTKMYENQVTQDNLKKISHYGVKVIIPAAGYLACGDIGAGKMPEPDELFAHIEKEIAREKDMTGVKVLVTAGATREALDPVRYITNPSSGKMGFAIAKECMMRGADVIIVKAATTAEVPRFCHVVETKSAADMYREVTRRSQAADIVFMAAAVSDYTPAIFSDQKIKKHDGEMSVEFKRTLDILARLGETRHSGQYLCGFSMETQNMVENSIAKLYKKNVDMIVANNLKVEGAGFGTDTNIVTFITKDGAEELEIMSKADVAAALVDRIMAVRKKEQDAE